MLKNFLRARFRTLLFIIGIFLTLFAGILGSVKYLAEQLGPLTQSKIFIVKKGSGLKNIATLLKKEGVINHSFVFRLWSWYLGVNNQLLAGEYKFSPKSSIQSIVLAISSGDTVKRRLTIPEGLLAIQIKKIILSAPGLLGEVPDSLWRDGTMLPETYFYSYGDTRLSIVKRMRKKLNDEVKIIWRTRSENSLLKTVKEALVLASIIEKETGKIKERSLVSGVFHNRLRLGMHLQSDPTVTYGITLGKTLLKRPLTKPDLRFPSPYNTYHIKGLPPRPICNPGLAAIRSAIMPAITPFLYFVADGGGGHVFSSTLKSHNRNVLKWRRLKRKAN